MKADSPVAVRVVPSPNHDARRGERPPDIVLLHYTGMDNEAETMQRLRDPLAKVSCHYLVSETGYVWQLTPEARRAWHAGVGSWAGETDINSRSIGIEIANRGHNYPDRDSEPPPFADVQIDVVIRLVADIAIRWRIVPHRILAHSDIAPGRKRDPGEKFPWQRLHAAGIGHWVEPSPIRDGPSFAPGDSSPPVAAIQAMLALYGYGLLVTGVYDETTKNVVEAFQRHFRPERIDGIADISTVTTLRALIAALPGR